MPLPVIPPIEAAEQRTCDSYTVRRLGMHPSMSMVFTETLVDVISLSVVSATDSEEDGVFNILEVSGGTPADIVGKELLKDDDSPLGTCLSLEGTELMLETGVETDPTGEVLHYTRINGFGEIVARASVGGKTYNRRLSADVPEQLSKMQEVLGMVAFNLVLGVLTELELEVDPQDVAQALQVMAGQGDNLDSFIVRQLEDLEEDILNGDVPSVLSSPV